MTSMQFLASLHSETQEILEMSKIEDVFLYLDKSRLFYWPPNKSQVDFSTLTNNKFLHFT